MTATGTSRRTYLTGLMAATSAGVLGACGVAGGPAEQTSPAKTTVTPLRIWFHWGGVRGETIQKMMEEYNATQGQQDKNHVTAETVKDSEMMTKMTAAVVGGDAPDVWHSNQTPRASIDRGLIASVPKEDEQYIKKNYVPGATDRVTLQGKIWGYPTEFQAPAYLYRKSHFAEVGLSKPPANTDEVMEYATKLTRKSGGTTERFGFALNDGWLTGQLPALIARFGGQMYHFNGDKPTKIDVASPQALEAVGWLKRMVDAGLTQIGQDISYADAMRQGRTASTEAFVWFVTGNTRDRGLHEIFEDLGAEVMRTKRGVKPIVYASGWSLVAPNSAKQPEERWKLMRWMMHKPGMPFSRFIVDFVGSMPAPTEYPAKVEGWTDALSRAFAVETPKVAQSHPTTKILGGNELNPATTETLKAILANELSLQTGLQQLNTKLNEILLRTNP